MCFVIILIDKMVPFFKSAIVWTPSPYQAIMIYESVTAVVGFMNVVKKFQHKIIMEKVKSSLTFRIWDFIN